MGKKLIVFGSSVALGQGADHYHGWAAMLSEQLAPYHWQVDNRSVCGDTTKRLLARVRKDVLELNPDAVLIAVSLGNEGLCRGFKRMRCRRFLKNMKILVGIFRAHGIQPFITNVYPNLLYREKEYAYVQQMNLDLDQLNAVVFNVGGCVDDLTGKWLPGAFADYGHPNDTGHLEMLSAICPLVFDNPNIWAHNSFRRSSYFPNSSKSLVLRLKVSPELRSFTLDFELKPREEGIVAELASDLKLISLHGKLNIFAGQKIIGGLKLAEHIRLMITWHPLNGEVRIYEQANLLCSLHKPALCPEDFCFFEKCAAFNNFLLYRGRLSEKILKYIWQGNMYFSSLELFAVLNEEADHGRRIKNLCMLESELISDYY